MKIKQIFIIVFTFFQVNLNAQENKTDLTVEKIWKNYEFQQKRFPGFRSMRDGIHFTKMNNSAGNFSITKHSFENYKGMGEVIVSKGELSFIGETIKVDDYEFNNDETKLLITTNSVDKYRRSYTADFFILDLKTKKLLPIGIDLKNKTLAEFSPNGEKVAFISRNNLFIYNISDEKITQITHDGKENEIINGTTDWVYEEEFAITKAFYWSPDSRKIAFMRSDESKVKEFQLAYYGELYPFHYKFKYPKAGEDNSKVSMHIYDINSNKISHLELGDYEYIPRFKWSPKENTLVVLSLNRHQNHLKYHLFELNSSEIKHKMFFEEKSNTYINIDDNLIILNSQPAILRTSDESGFNHIQKVNFDGKASMITSGNFDIIDFFGVSNDEKKVYYSAAEKNAYSKGIYRIELNGKKKEAISKETGYNNAEFSIGMKYFMKSFSDANTPLKYTLCTNNGDEIVLLEDNEILLGRMKNYYITSKEFIQIQGADQLLNASIIKPKNFDPNKKYPVYLNVYGGPGSNLVIDNFAGNDYFYHQLLAQKGYIVIAVDPRGTQFRGTAFKKSTYLQLGKLELEDVKAVAKALGQLPYVDAKRIGIQGWSFGGYLTSLAMTKGEDLFKMGIAVAPVTNWKYYDNIYTERFMRTPAENPAGYEENSPINFTKNLKGKYFIIHGSGDDNVHYQNTMEMISKLVDTNIPFDMFIYPNKNHGIYGGNTRNHLFNMMLEYTLKNL